MSSVISVETHSENADTHITHPSHSYLTVSVFFFSFICFSSEVGLFLR